MKNFFNVLSLAVVAAFVLASCQKEEDILPVINIEKDLSIKEIPFEVAHPEIGYSNKKFGIATPPSTVIDVYPSYFGEPSVTYNTRIIGNQEWLIEDWRNYCVDQDANAELGVFESPNYPGEQYYEWARILKDTPQNIWDNYVFPEKAGFHIPTHNDVVELVSTLGSANAIIQSLSLDAYNDAWTGSSFGTGSDQMRFWINDEYSGNLTEGCGAFVKVETFGVTYCYPSISDFGIRVRLVRSIN